MPSSEEVSLFSRALYERHEKEGDPSRGATDGTRRDPSITEHWWEGGTSLVQSGGRGRETGLRAVPVSYERKNPYPVTHANEEAGVELSESETRPAVSCIGLGRD